MNTQPIENARDSDLRLSRTAMLRAAERARELARQTGTRLVVVRQGVIEHISPESLRVAVGVREPEAGYGDKK